METTESMQSVMDTRKVLGKNEIINLNDDFVNIHVYGVEEKQDSTFNLMGTDLIFLGDQSKHGSRITQKSRKTHMNASELRSTGLSPELCLDRGNLQQVEKIEISAKVKDLSANKDNCYVDTADLLSKKKSEKPPPANRSLHQAHSESKLQSNRFKKKI